MYPESSSAPRLLVVGAGATGGYFGARLAQAGRDVTFLVRPGRAAQIQADGLQIASPHGDATLHPPLLVTTEPKPSPFDAIILAVKAYALDPAIDDLARYVGPDTVIMPLLNGMRHLDRLIERFGERPVLGGVCAVATTVEPSGRIRQLADMQQLTVGERDGTSSERVATLHAALSGAGFDARASSTILLDMWEKWVFLAALGALTCLLRGTVGEIVSVPGGADLARRIQAETTSVARAAGFEPRATHAKFTTDRLTAAGSGMASSMYRDLQAAAAVEVEQILADMVARATEFGLDVPLLAAATAQLRVYENQRLTRS